MILFFLRIQIRCLISHTTKSKQVFDINIPKCEEGEIYLIPDLLYTGSSQKTKNIRLKSLDEVVEGCKQI